MRFHRKIVAVATLIVDIPLTAACLVTLVPDVIWICAVSCFNGFLDYCTDCVNEFLGFKPEEKPDEKM